MSYYTPIDLSASRIDVWSDGNDYYNRQGEAVDPSAIKKYPSKFYVNGSVYDAPFMNPGYYQNGDAIRRRDVRRRDKQHDLQDRVFEREQDTSARGQRRLNRAIDRLDNYERRKNLNTNTFDDMYNPDYGYSVRGSSRNNYYTPFDEFEEDTYDQNLIDSYDGIPYGSVLPQAPVVPYVPTVPQAPVVPYVPTVPQAPVVPYVPTVLQAPVEEAADPAAQVFAAPQAPRLVWRSLKGKYYDENGLVEDYNPKDYELAGDLRNAAWFKKLKQQAAAKNQSTFKFGNGVWYSGYVDEAKQQAQAQAQAEARDSVWYVEGNKYYFDQNGAVKNYDPSTHVVVGNVRDAEWFKKLNQEATDNKKSYVRLKNGSLESDYGIAYHNYIKHVQPFMFAFPISRAKHRDKIIAKELEKIRNTK